MNFGRFLALISIEWITLTRKEPKTISKKEKNETELWPKFSLNVLLRFWKGSFSRFSLPTTIFHDVSQVAFVYFSNMWLNFIICFLWMWNRQSETIRIFFIFNHILKQNLFEYKFDLGLLINPFTLNAINVLMSIPHTYLLSLQSKVNLVKTKRE